MEEGKKGGHLRLRRRQADLCDENKVLSFNMWNIKARRAFDLRHVFYRACLFEEVCSGLRGHDRAEGKEPAEASWYFSSPLSGTIGLSKGKKCFQLEAHDPSSPFLFFSIPAAVQSQDHGGIQHFMLKSNALSGIITHPQTQCEKCLGHKINQ